jgi:hypothetical protein
VNPDGSAVTISDEERSERHNHVWDKVIGPAIDAAFEPLRALKQDVPSELVHFTGASALVSILQHQRLRLSTVLASNDPMEMKYGLGLAQRYVNSIKNGSERDRVFKATVRVALKGELPSGKEKRLPSPHVCCFSLTESVRKVEHWALYGRGGSGFALVFDGAALSSRGLADLVPVVYRERQQRKLIGDVIERGRRAASEAGQYAMDTYRDGDWANRTFGVTAHAFGTAASHVAAVAKRKEFRFENEWRLLAGRLAGANLDGPKIVFEGAAVGPVIRTFYEYPFQKSDLKAVIVGPVHADLNMTAVKDLIDEWEYDVDVRVGEVALRTISG